MSVKILEHIEAQRKAMGLTRAGMAERMNDVEDSAGGWDKTRLDKIMNNPNSCPTAETLSTMKLSVGIPDFTPSYYRAKRTGKEEA